MATEKAKLEQHDSDALVRAAGLDPWPEWRDDIRRLYPFLAAMVDRLRVAHDRGEGGDGQGGGA